MAILAAELIMFSSLNHPVDDAATSGGAIDATSRPELTQYSANAVMVVKSDGADTRTGAVRYRTTAGVIATWNFTLNGATEVNSGITAERILDWHVDSTSGTRVASLLQGAGGTVRSTIAINEDERILLFRDSTSEASIAVRHEKPHFKNTNATLSLTTATLKLTADPSTRYRQAICAAKGDSTSVTNRKTVPGGVTFVDDNVAQAVPTGALAAGENIGFWVEQNLPANDPPNKTTVTFELAGSSI